MLSSLVEINIRKKIYLTLALDVDVFLNEIGAQPIDGDKLQHKFDNLVMTAAAAPISGGAYRIGGSNNNNLRVAEEAILPELLAAEAANDTPKIEYYNMLLGHLLENKPLPEAAELDGMIAAAGSTSIIKPEDLIMTRADFEALGSPIVIPLGTPGDAAKRAQFSPPISEPFRTQIEVAKVIMAELTDPAKDILNNPDKINTELLYKSMIVGLFEGGGINAYALNSVTNLLLLKWVGTVRSFKPVDIYNAVAAAETDAAYQDGTTPDLTTKNYYSKFNTSYLTLADVPEFEDSYLQNNSLIRAIGTERKRIDDNINPSNSNLKEIAEQSDKLFTSIFFNRYCRRQYYRV